MKPTICLPICVTLILICLNAVTSQRSSSCCLKTNDNKIPMRRVRDYRIQKAGICPIDAIVLLTKKRKEICCDPKSDWTKRVMKMVERKRVQNKTQKPRRTNVRRKMEKKSADRKR